MSIDRLTELINKCMSSHWAHTKPRTTATSAVYNFKLLLKFRFRFVWRATVYKWYMYRPICPLFSFPTPLTSLLCSFAPKGKYITLTNSHLYLSQIFTHSHTHTKAAAIYEKATNKKKNVTVKTQSIEKKIQSTIYFSISKTKTSSNPANRKTT